MKEGQGILTLEASTLSQGTLPLWGWRCTLHVGTRFEVEECGTVLVGVGAVSPRGAPHHDTRCSCSCVPDLPQAGTVEQLALSGP